VQAHQHVMAVPVHQTEYQVARENRNEIQLIFSGLFLFYKSFISSQDGVSCVFTPSCSEYALMAIKKQGVMVGMANAIDRMTRCNGLSPEKYQKAPNSPLMIDELK
jgi:putative membrane protein insertion efficiency factor